jgi:alpha/beta superfamily hydrolase
MAEPKRLEFIPAADHFFKNALDEFEQRLRDVLTADILPARAN